MISNRHNWCAVCEREFRTPAGLRVHVECAAVHRDDSDDDSDDEEESGEDEEGEEEEERRRGKKQRGGARRRNEVGDGPQCDWRGNTVYRYACPLAIVDAIISFTHPSSIFYSK